MNKDKASSGSSDIGAVVVGSSTLRDETLKRVLIFGDSNAFRPGGGNRCWAALLGNKDPDQLDVFNESCNGRTTQYDIGEYNGLDVIGEKLIAHAPLDYVVLILGTNDLKNKYGPPDATDVAIGASRIIDVISAQNSGIKPIIVTPPPLGNVTSGDLAGAQSRIPPVAAEYRLLAMNRDVRLVDVHAILDSSTDLELDKIHLNARGRQKVANAVWTNLQDVTAPPKVAELVGRLNSAYFDLTWRSSSSDTFYYRVRKNGYVIGRTMGTSFEIAVPVADDSFTVEAVDFSQNVGPASIVVTCD